MSADASAVSAETLQNMYDALGELCVEAAGQDGTDWFILMAARAIVHQRLLRALHPGLEVKS